MSLEFILQFINEQGYLALLIVSFIEGTNFPIPSEPALLYSGVLVGQSNYSYLLMVIMAATGSTIGANLCYAIGRWGGRPLLYKYRKIFLLTKKELDTSDKWFDEHRIPVILFGRMIPLIRTLIAFPAGIYETPFWLFNLLTFTGAALWSALLIYLGSLLGARWESILVYTEKYQDLALLLVFFAVVWYIWHKVHKIRRENREPS